MDDEAKAAQCTYFFLTFIDIHCNDFVGFHSLFSKLTQRLHRFLPESYILGTELSYFIPFYNVFPWGIN